MGAGMFRRHFALLLKLPVISENILQGELHNTRIRRRSDLTEISAVQIVYRVTQVDGVRYVKRFGAELDLLLFTNLEASGDRKVELPCTRTSDTATS